MQEISFRNNILPLKDKLFRVALRITCDSAEAEDILQECLLKIYFNIKEFNGTGSFIGWLRKVAVNTAITHYHKNLKFRYNIDIDESSTVGDLISKKSKTTRINKNK